MYQRIQLSYAPLLWLPAFVMASTVLAAEIGYQVIAEYPHDPDAFTQGLVFHNGFLYESTGRFGASSIRKVDPKTGEVLEMRRLPDDRFGEGLTVVGNRLVQLTWRSRTGYVYDVDNLEPAGRFYYQTEGWGLTYDGEHLLMSDGSSTIYLLDPDTFGLTGKLQVHDGGRPVVHLNELEFVDGFIYANVWLTTRIAKIDPQTGRVVAWVELAGLAPPSTSGADVLNGIAFSPRSKNFYVTGKLWPQLFVINMKDQ